MKKKVVSGKLKHGDTDKFNINSLDNFKRFQKVQECWRKINNNFVLVPNEFIEDWDLSKRRKVAEAILKVIDHKNVVYGAYFQDEIVDSTSK